MLGFQFIIFRVFYIIIINKSLFSILCKYILISCMILVYWKVFSSLASAAIRIRASGIRKYLKLRSDKDIDGNISQYKFGMALKETMLSLGPTFIKGKEYCLIEVLISIGPSALYLIFSPNYFFCFQYCSLNYMLGPYFFLLQSQDYQYASYMPFLADAVGQSLSTRPDIIGTEISKVSLKRVFHLAFYWCSFWVY